MNTDMKCLCTTHYNLRIWRAKYLKNKNAGKKKKNLQLV